MRFSIAIMLLVTSGALRADGAEWKASEVVTSYVSGTSPTLILGLDNNLEICLALREPATSGDLRSRGVTHTRSQLVLLELWKLVERSEDARMRCTVPVVEGAAARQIGARAQAVAQQLATDLGAAIDGYLNTVSDLGWPESRYALLGSFVLDGLVWQALARLGAIENADASALPSGSEHWSGVTWITLPPQMHKLGTNSHRTDRGTLYAAWTPPALEAQRVLQQPGVREELVASALGRFDGSMEHAALLQRLGLVHDGRSAVPGIGAESRLCTEGSRLALQVAEALLATEAMDEIRRLTDAPNDSVALIMGYHWVYPALLGRLEGRGLESPAVLRGKAGAALAPSLFVVADGAECFVPMPLDGVPG